MKQAILITLASFSPFLSTPMLVSTSFSHIDPTNEQNYQIILHNRPLVKVYKKTFSVMDVKKQMDLFLKEHHPEQAAATLLTYQFYLQNWKNTLQEMINNELIKMEATEYKITLSDGDIREEMEKRFGPNMMDRLDALQLSYQEAKELVKESIIIQNMSWYRIWAKALQRVTPEVIKMAYEDHLSQVLLSDEWTYKMITLKDEDPNIKNTQAIAKKAYEWIHASLENLSFDQKIATMKKTLPKTVSLNISEPLKISSKNLSSEILQTLQQTQLLAISKPIVQKSRSNSTPVYRMFYLMNHEKKAPPPFETLSTKIQDTLLQKEGETQKQEYFSKLRKRFLCEDLVVKNLFSEHYQPFTICES